MVVLTILLPGVGLLQRLRSAKRWDQYMINIPMIAKMGIIGCKETKKHVNKNKFTI
jgi:hypothetical protein